MYGYGDRGDNGSTGVHDRLYGKVLVLAAGDGDGEERDRSRHRHARPRRLREGPGPARQGSGPRRRPASSMSSCRRRTRTRLRCSSPSFRARSRPITSTPSDGSSPRWPRRARPCVPLGWPVGLGPRQRRPQPPRGPARRHRSHAVGEPRVKADRSGRPHTGGGSRSTAPTASQSLPWSTSPAIRSCSVPRTSRSRPISRRDDGEGRERDRRTGDVRAGRGGRHQSVLAEDFARGWRLRADEEDGGVGGGRGPARARPSTLASQTCRESVSAPRR